MPSKEQSLLPDRIILQNHKCPNCGQNAYTESVSKEECKACGLLCDYWGSGTNQVYRDMMARNHAAQAIEDEERQRKLMQEMYGDPNES